MRELDFCQCDGCAGKYKLAIGIVEDPVGIQINVCKFHYECAIENGWRDVMENSTNG